MTKQGWRSGRRAEAEVAGSHARPARGSTGRRPRRVLLAVFGAAAVSATMAVPASAYQRPGVTQRVSVGALGAESNGVSRQPSISADGRYIAFGSVASNLVAADDNNLEDVFVYDRATATTQRVSLDAKGGEANRACSFASISADGRYVAFWSEASDLVDEDTNGQGDVFVYDRTTRVTKRASVASDGSQGNGATLTLGVAPAISATGRYVAFASHAKNLVSGDTNNQIDIFVHDRATGDTERVSVASGGAQGNGQSTQPSISADGRHVAFVSGASNFDARQAGGVFVHDRTTDVTERVSVATDGTQPNQPQTYPSISADGRFVAFLTLATNLVPGDSNIETGSVTSGSVLVQDVFVHDRLTRVTERVSVGSDGTEANGSSYYPSIGADGRFVSFLSRATNLTPDDANNTSDGFVHDRVAGITTRVSVDSAGVGGSAASAVALSDDGRHVAFSSTATNLVPGDANGTEDVFVRDLGPALGIGGLEAAKAGTQVSVSGWAGLSGMPLVSATDPNDDGASIGPIAPRDVGAEITGAEVVYRPEAGNLLLRTHLSSLPKPVVGGSPGVLYRWNLTVNGTAYEVRALRAAAAAPPGPPYFALYRCAPTCTETARLSGAIGTTGTDVLIAMPPSAVGASEEMPVTALRASTSVGEAAVGSLIPIDNVVVPDFLLPRSRVELGIAPASVAENKVVFGETAALENGRFTGALSTSGLASGPYRVWARACIGDLCGARFREVTM